MRRTLLVLATLALAGPFVRAGFGAAPVKGAHYSGRDVAGANDDPFSFVVARNGRNFASGTFHLHLLGQAGRGSCVGPAWVMLTPTARPQITSGGAFDLRATFPFKVTSSDPAAYRGTGHAIVRGAFSAAGARVTGTVTLTTTSPGLTCHTGSVRFSGRRRL